MSKIVPFNQKNLLRKDSLDNMLDDFFDDFWIPVRMPNAETFKLDVKEDEGNYIVEAELPGVKKKDISLALNDGRLTIGVSEKITSDKDKRKIIHKERRCSYMERSIYLKDSSKDGANAALENGELIITVPKQKHDTSNQKIEIS